MQSVTAMRSKSCEEEIMSSLENGHAQIAGTEGENPGGLSVEISQTSRAPDEDKMSWRHRGKNVYVWIKWTAPLLALVAAIFAIPKGVVDLYTAIVSEPKTELMPESYLSVSYDPTQKLIEFGFGFTAANNGSKAETIKDASARIEAIGSSAAEVSLISFSDSDFSFAENNATISNRFPINKDSTRPVKASISYYLSDEKRAILIQPGTRRRLVVELTGQTNKSHTLQFCFDVTQSLVDDLFNSQIRATRRFREPECY